MSPTVLADGGPTPAASPPSSSSSAPPAVSGPLTFGELEALWIAAGGPAPWAPVMAGVALAESGGNPGSTNPTDNNGTQTSWGLWQISDGTHNDPAVSELGAAGNSLDPLTNAKEAVSKFHGGGLGPWTGDPVARVFAGSSSPPTLAQVLAVVEQGGHASSGQLSDAVDTTSSAVLTSASSKGWGSVFGSVWDWATAGGPLNPSGAGTPLGAVTGTLSFVSDVTQHVLNPAWWKRLALGAGGVALFVVGLVIFLSTTEEGQKVASEAETAAPLAALAA